MGLGGVDNDTRGWIMCTVSGVACVAGASLICVDLVVRLIPSQRNFSIQENNVFLACSLSLSFGVMLFSALYSMLPSSKHYLVKAGFADPVSGFIMMGCFVGGFFGIQVISRLLHQLIPSHVVDCDHTHDEAATEVTEDGFHSRRPSRVSRSRQRSLRRRSSALATVKIGSVAGVNGSGHGIGNGIGNGLGSESTPLLSSTLDQDPAATDQPVTQDAAAATQRTTPGSSKEVRSRAGTGTQNRRPSMLQVQSRVLSFVRDTKTNCDVDGPCYGYSDPCGQECFKHLASSRSNTFTPRSAILQRATTGTFYPRQSIITDVPEDDETDDATASPVSPTHRSVHRARSHDARSGGDGMHGHSHGHDARPHASHDHDHDHTHNHTHNHDSDNDDDDDDDNTSEQDWCSQMSEGDSDLEAQHHHHVPTNGFLSIGLQTVIAIGLHKFPEGFITYATNHANPRLGFNVFMALFVHNIAEGFAMALPLYLALGSRLRAMAWSSVLGGLSQPVGAGLAALWFRLARRSHVTIDAAAYACLFAATAGIMTSVALQLFVESLSLNHDRNLSIFCAFLGMTLLGVSNALVAD